MLQRRLGVPLHAPHRRREAHRLDLVERPSRRSSTAPGGGSSTRSSFHWMARRGVARPARSGSVARLGGPPDLEHADLAAAGVPAHHAAEGDGDELVAEADAERRHAVTHGFSHQLLRRCQPGVHGVVVGAHRRRRGRPARRDRSGRQAGPPRRRDGVRRARSRRRSATPRAGPVGSRPRVEPPGCSSITAGATARATGPAASGRARRPRPGRGTRPTRRACCGGRSRRPAPPGSRRAARTARRSRSPR